MENPSSKVSRRYLSAANFYGLVDILISHTIWLEMILRRDSRIAMLLKKFEGQSSGDSSFLETLHELISTLNYFFCTNLQCAFLMVAYVVRTTVIEAQTLYNELFFDTSLEVGKTLSKTERDTKQLSQEKVFTISPQ